MRPLLGAIAGAVATGPMTAVIALGRNARLLWTPPPEQITSSVAVRAGIEHDRGSEEFDVAWIVAHFAYGAACGAIYSVVRPILPGSLTTRGLIFGELVWSVSYLGLIPAIGLYPWPRDDSRTRMAVMIAAHAAFGIGAAHVEQLLAKMEDDSDCYVTLQPPVGLTSQRA